MSVFIPKDNTIAVTNYTGIPEGDSVVNVYDVVEGVINDYPAISGLHYTIQYPPEQIGKFTNSTGNFWVMLCTHDVLHNTIVVILQVSNSQQLITTITPSSLITTQPSVTVTVIHTNSIGKSIVHDKCVLTL